MNQYKKRIIKWLVAVIVLATAIFLFIWRLMPYSRQDIERSVVDIEHLYSYIIIGEGSPLLYFEGVTGDSILISPSVDKKYTTEHSLGCWINTLPLVPSCKGTIATVFTRTDSCMLDTAFMRSVIREEITNHETTLNAFDHARIEINYYLDTHSIKDEGFKDVLRYRDSLKTEYERIDSITSQLKKAVDSKDMSVVIDEQFYAVYKDINGKEIRRKCMHLPTHNVIGNTLIQLNDSITPEGVNALNTWNLVPLHPDQLNDTVFIMGRHYINNNDMMKRDIDMIPEYVSGDTLMTFPRLNIIKGSPVFNRHGFFIGIIGGDTIISRNIIRKSL